MAMSVPASSTLRVALISCFSLLSIWVTPATPSPQTSASCTPGDVGVNAALLSPIRTKKPLNALPVSFNVYSSPVVTVYVLSASNFSSFKKTSKPFSESSSPCGARRCGLVDANGTPGRQDAAPVGDA